MYIHLNVYEQMISVQLLLLYSNTWNYFTMFKQMINSK